MMNGAPRKITRRYDTVYGRIVSVEPSMRESGTMNTLPSTAMTTPMPSELKKPVAAMRSASS